LVVVVLLVAVLLLMEVIVVVILLVKAGVQFLLEAGVLLVQVAAVLVLVHKCSLCRDSQEQVQQMPSFLRVMGLSKMEEDDMSSIQVYKSEFTG
jgi:hypothetical protein